MNNKRERHGGMTPCAFARDECTCEEETGVASHGEWVGRKEGRGCFEMVKLTVAKASMCSVMNVMEA